MGAAVPLASAVEVDRAALQSRMAAMGFTAAAELAAAAGLRSSGQLTRVLAQAGSLIAAKDLTAIAAALECPEDDLRRAPAAANPANPVRDPAVPSAVRLCDIHSSKLNPRKTFDDTALEDLAASILARGLLQNLVVRPNPAGGWTIVAGERRWRAMRLLTERGDLPVDHPVPVRVIQAQDADHLLIAIVENLQRVNVNPMEEAEALADLQAFDPDTWTTAALARQIGCTPRMVQQRLALVTKLAQPVQDALKAGDITVSQARVLTSAPADRQIGLLKSIEHYPNADRLRGALTQKLFPVSRAAFDPDAAGLEIIETDDGERWFADSGAFLAAQRRAAENMRDVLAEEWAWAEIAENYLPSLSFETERSKDKSRAGAVVVFGAWSGAVTVETGLLRCEAPLGRKSDAELAREDREKAATERFRDALAREIAADPQLAFALWAFVQTTDCGRLLRWFDDGLPPGCFAKGGSLAHLGDLMTRPIDSTRQGAPAVAAAQVWERVSTTPALFHQDAFAAWIAARLQVSHHQRPLSPVLADVAARKNIAVPKHLLKAG